MIRAALFVAIAAVAVAQQPKAQISGFVRDVSNSPVAEAAVSAVNLDTGVRRSARSNDEGFFAISSLTPGQYKLTVRKPGFQTIARTGLDLHAMDVARIDFLLEIGAVREEITVTAPAPVLNTTDASQMFQTTRSPADALPVNGRGLQGLIDLAPGVLTTPATSGEAGQFSANGQRPATNYFTVDGVSANNGVSGSGLPGQFSGGALPGMTAIGSLHNLLTLGELDELRVQTSTFAPEYGRLPGAQVSATTRSGSNDFHGEAFASLRHEKLSANDPFAARRLTQRLIDSGFSLGGPIRRNSTFFHISSEHIALRQPVAFLMGVPPLSARRSGIARAFPLPDAPAGSVHTARYVIPADVTSTSGRVDQALGSSGTLFVRYNLTPSSSRSGYLQSNRADFDWHTVTAGIVTAFGSRATNDLRVGVSRCLVKSEWFPGASTLDLRTLMPPPGPGQRLWAIGIRGYSQLLTGDPGRSKQGQWTITDTLSFASGRHDLRAGFDYQRLTPERDQPIASVFTVYDTLEALDGPPPPYTFAQTGGGSTLIETLSLFVQDTWHATPRLNVTYGVRWEWTPPPSYRVPPSVPQATTLPAGFEFVPALLTSPAPVWKTRASQFAPRLGLAYRVSDALVVRAGAGLFYDLGFSSAVDLLNGAPYNRWRSGVGIALAPMAETVQYGFEPNLRLPRTFQWNVAVERAFTGEAAVSIAYVGSAGRHLLRREGRVETGRSTPSMVLATNHGRSDYHSMQLHFRSRNWRGLQGTASYTWAHAIDNGSWDSAIWLLLPGVVSGADRASANFDVRHGFQAGLAYTIRRRWTVSGTLRARTGFPIDVVTTEHPFGLGFDNEFRPDLAPGAPVWIDGSLNRAAFAAPPRGRQGTLGRNAIEGLPLKQLDLALERRFVLSESARLHFRAELYNLTNTINLADPVRVLASPLFGQPASLTNLMLGAGRPNSGLTPAFQSGGPRTLQLGVALRF
jgi:hypothetical protein